MGGRCFSGAAAASATGLVRQLSVWEVKKATGACKGNHLEQSAAIDDVAKVDGRERCWNRQCVHEFP